MQVTVRECHPQKIQCMLGALQSAFREPAFLHKGGDALSKMYLTTFTTFHWSFSHKLHTPSMISSRSSSIIHPVSSSTETRKTPPKPRRHRLIPFHCTHTHHCSQTCRPWPSAIAFATFFSQLGAAAVNSQVRLRLKSYPGRSAGFVVGLRETEHCFPPVKKSCRFCLRNRRSWSGNFWVRV